MTRRAMLFAGAGAVLVLLGVLVAAVGGYAAYVTGCEQDADADGTNVACLDVWSYVTYAGGTLAVVGGFAMLSGWIRYAYG